MTARAAFSLLETLLAAAILAMVVAACLPLLTSSATAAAPLRPGPELARYAEQASTILSPNLTIEQSPSTVAREIQGTWVTIRAGDRIALTWIPAQPISVEGTP